MNVKINDLNLCENVEPNLEKNEGGLLMRLPNNIKHPAVAAAMALCATNANDVLAQNVESKGKLEQLSSSIPASSFRKEVNTDVLMASNSFNPYLDITYGALHMKSNASLGKIPLTKEYIENIVNPLLEAQGANYENLLVKIEDTPLNEEPITGDNVVRIFIDSITMTPGNIVGIKSSPIDEIAGRWENRLSSFNNEDLEGFALVLTNLKENFAQKGVEEHLNANEFYHGLIGAASVWTTGMRNKFKNEGREIPDTLKEANSLALPGDIYKVLSATSQNPEELKNDFFKVFPTDKYQEMTGSLKGEGYILPKNPNLELLAKLQDVLGDEVEVPEYFEIYGQYLESYKESIAYVKEAAKRNHKSSNKKLYKETSKAKRSIDEVQEMPSNMQALIAQRYEAIINSDMSTEEKDLLVAKLFTGYKAVTSSLNEFIGGEDVKIRTAPKILKDFEENPILISSAGQKEILEGLTTIIANSFNNTERDNNFREWFYGKYMSTVDLQLKVNKV